MTKYTTSKNGTEKLMANLKRIGGIDIFGPRSTYRKLYQQFDLGAEYKYETKTIVQDSL